MQLNHFSLETEQSLSTHTFKVIELDISLPIFQDLVTKNCKMKCNWRHSNVSISSSATINYTKKTQQFVD